jgi:hypothetical protein
MDSSLFDRTLDLLATRDCSLETIAHGAGVGVSWLQKFSLRRIPNAGAVRVQRVHDYLQKRDAAFAAAGLPKGRTVAA